MGRVLDAMISALGWLAVGLCGKYIGVGIMVWMGL